VTDRAFDGVLAPAPGQHAARDIATAADFFALLKPRVMSLVIFTGLVGLVVAPGAIHPAIAFTALLCIAIGAGAAGALNMWYDADIDVGMARTRDRPVAAGRVAPGAALGFGLTLAAGSVVVMGLMVNLVAAALLALTIAFYAIVYTMWLKRRTPQNIVIGGAAGALPPMIGWAAVTGAVGLESFVLFAIIFMWTPPHFWALALRRADEYGRVGVPMLPVVAGPDATRNQILVYSLLLVPITLLPWAMGFAGRFYGIAAAVLGVLFLAGAAQVWRVRAEPQAGAWAMRLFSYSILYLFLLFGALLAEHALGLWA
jgi:protoheme IX farnesyltransferase